MKTAVNLGSGQRRYESIPGLVRWHNIDAQSIEPDRIADVICTLGKEPLPFDDGSVDVAVAHHLCEHLVLADANALSREVHRVLKDGASFIVTVPNLRALAERWLAGGISDYIFYVNVYGAWIGEIGDLHKWAVTLDNFPAKEIWHEVKPFDWREVPGATICRDWWISGFEAVK